MGCEERSWLPGLFLMINWWEHVALCYVLPICISRYTDVVLHHWRANLSTQYDEERSTQLSFHRDYYHTTDMRWLMWRHTDSGYFITSTYRQPASMQAFKIWHFHISDRSYDLRFTDLNYCDLSIADHSTRRNYGCDSSTVRILLLMCLTTSSILSFTLSETISTNLTDNSVDIMKIYALNVHFWFSGNYVHAIHEPEV